VIQDSGWWRPASNDATSFEQSRERVVGAIEAGESCRSVSGRFGIAVSSTVKWSNRYHATSRSVAPGKMGGDRRRVLEPHRAFIAERFAQMPHLSQHGPTEELAARGVKVSHDAALQFLRRGLRFKKRCSPMSRPALTTCGAGLLDHLTAPCVFDRPINGRSFKAYVEQQLVPMLEPGDIVVMDNLGSHKSAAIRQLIRRCEALLSAALFPRPQSDQVCLRQDQALNARRAEAHREGNLATHRCCRHSDRTQRMRQLFRKRRIRSRQNLKRSSSVPDLLERLMAQPRWRVSASATS